jgi:transposase
LPASIEEYVAEDHPVRAYDAFIDALDFKELGIEEDPHKVGNSEYDPRCMMKLLVYGYSYGVKSSRKLEREVHNDLSFIWLMGGLRPDHKTISEFRRRHKDSLRRVLRESARVCVVFDLISGNALFVDGTKLRANASRNRSRKGSYYKKVLKDVEARIDAILEDCERVDSEEEGFGSFVSMDKELSRSLKRREDIKELLNRYSSGDDALLNETDPESGIMHSVQGSHSSYNVQSVVDDQHGLIVHAEAVQEGTDVNQFACQIERGNEVVEGRCEVACADAGYSDTEELEKVHEKGIKVVVPSQRQALKEGEKPFSKSAFRYDNENDCYYCPEGHRLRFSGIDKNNGKRHYLIENKSHCHNCRHFGVCTKAKLGRKVVRLPNEEMKEFFESQYEESDSQQIYRRRKFRAEMPFGHIKRNLNTNSFLLRGLSGVQAETSLLCTCFNMARMITIPGVPLLIDKLSSLRAFP